MEQARHQELASIVNELEDLVVDTISDTAPTSAKAASSCCSSSCCCVSISIS